MKAITNNYCYRNVRIKDGTFLILYINYRVLNKNIINKDYTKTKRPKL